MILRDHTGTVIYKACRWLLNCPGPLEAELAACEDGLKLALHWTHLPLQVETDCAESMKLLVSGSSERSTNMFQVAAISGMMNERSVQLIKISRSQNKATHAMAAMGRSQQSTTCWLGNSP